ncbi:hypothetical protein Syun_005946 [Stephania yunnanensis]|uniref:Uncharacterized protein n=1 Tax=Stephania yunnanensis TaxID=152371 RepID=A0AAP0KWQ5_9MAGN
MAPIPLLPSPSQVPTDPHHPIHLQFFSDGLPLDYDRKANLDHHGGRPHSHLRRHLPRLRPLRLTVAPAPEGALHRALLLRKPLCSSSQPIQAAVRR